MKKLSFFICLVLSFSLLAAAACVRKPQSTAEVPRLVSEKHRVAVAPFSQPLVPSQLFTGQLPIPQGKIPPDELRTLDRDLRDTLYSDGHRQFDFLPLDATTLLHGKMGAQPAALDFWLSYGEKNKLDYLLVPQVLDWHERLGSEAGVTSSASVRLEFFLLAIPQKTLVGRSIYEEKQVGLIDNILTVGDFIKRKGRWVSANALALEAIKQAVMELGL